MVKKVSSFRLISFKFRKLNLLMVKFRTLKKALQLCEKKAITEKQPPRPAGTPPE